MPEITISNVEVIVTSEHTDNACLSCQYKGARYHVWVNRETGRMEPTLYKNPLVKRGEPGHFESRRLKADAKENAKIVRTMLAQAVATNLFAKAEQKIKNEIAEQRRNRKEAERLGRIKEAGPELLEAVENYFKVWNVEIGPAEQALLDEIEAIRAKVDGTHSGTQKVVRSKGAADAEN